MSRERNDIKMNKNGKIKGKFNIIDLLAIILVIGVVVGIAVRFGSSITTAVQSNEEFIYTVKVEGVRDYTIAALKKGGKITDKKSEIDLGEIVDVKSEPAVITAERADGKIVNAPQPDRYTAIVTIKTYGKEADNSYITADSNELSVGRVTEIFSKYVHTSGKIMSVTKTGE